MSYRATRSVMDLLIAEMIHRMEYDDKTKEPSSCLKILEKTAAESKSLNFQRVHPTGFESPDIFFSRVSAMREL